MFVATPSERFLRITLSGVMMAAAVTACSLQRDGLLTADEPDAFVPGAGGASGAAGASPGTGGTLPEAGKDVLLDTSEEPEADAPDVVDAPWEADASTDALTDGVDEESSVLKQPGEPCGGPDECASGSCDDSVCCATPCAGPCRACNAQGVCEPAAAGTDVGGECGSCGKCDGAGRCECPTGQSCSSALDPDDCAQQGQCLACSSDTECPSGRCENCACQPPLGNSVLCNEDTDCASKHCNQVWDPLDCAAQGSCQDCGTDTDCASGRCEYCKCATPVQPAQYCDEPSDCTTGRCGSDPGSDINDCSGKNLCAECSDDVECAEGRCETCKCVEPAAAGFCNEDSDCLSKLCGSEVGGDIRDCATAATCVECRADTQCQSGRCDICQCVAKSDKGDGCDEDTDCVSGVCTTFVCQ